MSSANEKKKRTFKNKYGRNETTLFERIVDEKNPEDSKSQSRLDRICRRRKGIAHWVEMM